jgi:hypothetical protein
MKTGIVLVLALTACAAPSPAPSHVSAAAQEVTSAPVSEAAEAPPIATGPSADLSLLESDVAAMTGGHFAVDHIGPKAYEAVLARFQSAPLAYMTRARRLSSQADARLLATMCFENVIVRAAATNGREAAEVARAMLPRYHAAHAQAVTAPAWDGQVDLLDGKIAALTRVAEL